jgi:putative nucleotidyltransferase with HDIG domain
MKASELERIVSSLDRIPTLPVIYTKLGTLLQSPDATIQAVSNIISEDQVIAAKLLKFVNSAFYGFPQRIGSLQRAIVILGFNAIKNLVFATSVFDMFRGMETADTFSKKNFWKHCIGCAVASRVLAEAADLRNPEEIFTGGLLHDIGKLIVAVQYPDKFSTVISEVQRTGTPMVEAERNVFGVDHPQVGCALALHWRFPPETADMIGAHHLGDGAAPQRKDIAAVHIGNILCMALGLGAGGEKRLAGVNTHAWELLGISLNSLELVMEKTVKLYRENMEILEM